MSNTGIMLLFSKIVKVYVTMLAHCQIKIKIHFGLILKSNRCYLLVYIEAKYSIKFQINKLNIYFTFI